MEVMQLGGLSGWVWRLSWLGQEVRANMNLDISVVSFFFPVLFGEKSFFAMMSW